MSHNKNNSLLEAAENKVRSQNGTGKAVQNYSKDSNLFQEKWNMATALSHSELIPQQFKGKIADVMIAMELAEQMKMSLFTVTQNLDIIKGKTGWKSTFIIATINNSKRFKSELMFEFNDKQGDEFACRAFAINKDDLKVNGTWISIQMAKDEGWTKSKKDTKSKWVTMPEQMMQYRAAAFFGRLHVPDLLMGLQSTDEIIDVENEITFDTVKTNDDILNEKSKSSSEPIADAVISEDNVNQQDSKTEQQKNDKTTNNEEPIEILKQKMDTLKELEDSLSFGGFEIIEKKENNKQRTWAKISPKEENPDYDIVMSIKGIKSMGSYLVLDITDLL